MSEYSGIANFLGIALGDAVTFCDKTQKALGHSLTPKSVYVYLRKFKNITDPNMLAKAIRADSPGLAQKRSRSSKRTPEMIQRTPPDKIVKMIKETTRVQVNGPTGREEHPIAHGNNRVRLGRPLISKSKKKKKKQI